MSIKIEQFIKVILINFIIILIIVSCSPVRTGKQSEELSKNKSEKFSTQKSKDHQKFNNNDNTMKSQKEVIKNQQSNNMDNNPQNNDKNDKISENLKTTRIKKRNSDTTVINLDINPVSLKEYAENFNNLVFEFDKGKYDKTCDKFEEYSKVFPETDSLYFESVFFIAECNIASENYQEASKLFSKIIESNFTPLDILQRSLLRLGQVKCNLNRKDEAQAIFDKLKREFPRSIYLKLANCNF